MYALAPLSDLIVWLSDERRDDEGRLRSGRPSRDSARPHGARGIGAARRVRISDDDARVLVERVRASDESAFRQTYLAFYHPLWEFAYSLTNSADVAEDVVQDVFARWWERRGEIRITRGLDPYLYGAVRHRAANWRRHDRIQRRDDVVATAETLVPDAVSSDIQVELSELEHALARAIAKLPPQRRAALMLRVRHDLDYAAIAQALGISAPAAMIHVSRARTALRRVLDDQTQD